VRSVAGSAYDVLGSNVAGILAEHSGMKFTTPDMDYDLFTDNCASMFGGGFWYSKCALWAPTLIPIPVWYNLGDNTWQGINIVHMMIKLQ